MLARNRDDLFFREPLPLHLSVIQSRPDSNPHGGKSQWQVRSCEPGLPCSGAEHAMAVGVHLYQHLVGLHLHGFRYRRPRPHMRASCSILSNSPRNAAAPCWASSPWLNQTALGKPGMVHLEASRNFSGMRTKQKLNWRERVRLTPYLCIKKLQQSSFVI